MKAFKELIKHAAAAEQKVMSLRREVRNTAAAALVSVPGFNANVLVAQNDGYTPVMKSVAEETISCHNPLESFTWQEGTWVRINS